jgi:hypothetical protein
VPPDRSSTTCQRGRLDVHSQDRLLRKPGAYRELEEDSLTRVMDGTMTAANAMVKLLRLQQVNPSTADANYRCQVRSSQFAKVTFA